MYSFLLPPSPPLVVFPFYCSSPAMQEDALKLVLLALEDGSALSRKVLVLFVVQKLEARFPQASKTSIGHVVQLLYRASCFKVLATWLNILYTHSHQTHTYVHLQGHVSKLHKFFIKYKKSIIPVLICVKLNKRSSVCCGPKSTQDIINYLIKTRIFK